MPSFLVSVWAPGVFKGAGMNLSVETDRDEFALGIVVVFILRHTSPALEGF